MRANPPPAVPTPEDRGFIQLWRELRETPLWYANSGRKATGFEAWLDLRYMAAYRPQTIRHQGETVRLFRGQLVVSIRRLADRFQWSPNRVSRWLEGLEGIHRVKTERTHRRTILTLLDYDTSLPAEYGHEFGKPPIGEYTDEDPERGTSRHTHGHTGPSNHLYACNLQTLKKERKAEGKEGKSTQTQIDDKPESELDGFQAFWDAYPKKQAKEPARRTWIRLKPPLGEVLEALRWQTESGQWQLNGGRFIPKPAKYLEEHRWEDRPIPADLPPQIPGVPLPASDAIQLCGRCGHKKTPYHSTAEGNGRCVRDGCFCDQFLSGDPGEPGTSA